MDVLALCCQRIRKTRRARGVSAAAAAPALLFVACACLLWQKVGLVAYHSQDEALPGYRRPKLLNGEGVGHYVAPEVVKECTERDVWLSSSSRQPATPSPTAAIAGRKVRRPAKAISRPDEGDWRSVFACSEADFVCFRNSDLVRVGHSENEDDTFFNPPAPDSDDGFRWFEKQEVAVNMPGYHDGGGKWVQHVETPLGVRIVARGVERNVLEAPVLNITPLVVFTFWPNNLAESFRNFIFTWTSFSFRNPEAARRFPLVLVTAHELPMPSFWRLLEPWTPSIKSFSSLGSRACAPAPLCFRRVVGCNQQVAAQIIASRKLKQSDWPQVVSHTISHFCPSEGRQNEPGARRPLIVVFGTRRLGYRRILNLAELRRSCEQTPDILGVPVMCEEMLLEDVTKDICMLQRVDVLISVHGAQITNAMYMRPGSSVLEVRAHKFYKVNEMGMLMDEPHMMRLWANLFMHMLHLTNSTFYWWYGVGQNSTYKSPLTKKNFPRDMDVTLSWSVLRCMLAKIVEVAGSQMAYESLPRIGNFGTCEFGFVA